MLNFRKLHPQITDLVGYRQGAKEELARKLKRARDLLDEGVEDQLRKKALESKTSWLIGVPLDESLSRRVRPCLEGRDYIAVATDGSQIAPSRDAAGQLHLVNIGEVAIGYGSTSFAMLDSHPYLAFEDGETTVLFGGEERQVAGSALAAKRDRMEYLSLYKGLQRHAGEKPLIGLIDGTLILWHIEPRAEALKALDTADLKRQVFETLFDCLLGARSIKALVASYISAPGSREVVNLLRMGICTEDSIDCNNCPYVSKEEKPCRALEGLADASLFRSILDVGERSAVFETTSSNASSVLGFYPPEIRPCFFYLNTGKEIARIELPFWLAEDEQKRDVVHALVLDQARKGSGYPITLAEAHEQAVVKGSDRETFNVLVSSALIKRGVPVEDSRKSLNKRRAFV